MAPGKERESETFTHDHWPEKNPPGQSQVPLQAKAWSFCVLYEVNFYVCETFKFRLILTRQINKTKKDTNNLLQ